LKYNPSADDIDENNHWKTVKDLLNGKSLKEVVDTISDFNDKISQILGTATIPAD